MKKLYLFIALFCVPFFIQAQCNSAPVINQGFNEIPICEASANKSTFLYFNFSNQEPVDSLIITIFRFTDAGQTQSAIEVATKKYEGRTAGIDLSNADFGFGIYAECIAENDCGLSNVVYIDIPVTTPLATPDCNNDYQSGIFGNDKIDLQDNSPQFYVLDSPELRDYLRINDLDSGQVYLEWQLKQFEGGEHFQNKYVMTASGKLSDTTMVFDSIPPGKSYVIFKAHSVCDCTNKTDWATYSIDTLVVEKTSLGVNLTGITGSVYGTDGSNCTATDLPLAKQIVRIDPIGKYAVTDNDGFYNVDLEEAGQYNVILYTKAGQACQPSGVNTTVTLGQKSTVDLFQKFSEVKLEMSSWARATMQNSRFVQTISLKNLGKPLTGTLSCSVDQIAGLDLVDYDSTNPAADALTTTSATWNSLTLSPYQEHKISLGAVLQNVSMGDTICINLSYATADSTFTTKFSVIVRNSYDPNDKHVSMDEILGEDLDVEAPYLDYRIRFQNTGNDTAYNIVVTDTLPAGLDISTFEMGASSHSFSFDISDDNTVVWTFNEIMLPDSGTNQEASNGFILFKIKPFQNLEIGDQIKNKVNIYFDQNEPVITNEAITTITEKTTAIAENEALDYLIYPNPVNHVLHVSADQKIHSVSISTVDGSILKTKQLHSKTLSIDVKDLAPGIYFVLLKTEDGLQFSRKFIK